MAESIAKLLMRAALAIVVLSVSGILIAVCVKGIPSLSWSMISQTSKGGFFLGKGGGILNAIVGSLYLAGAATCVSLAISTFVALYLRAFLKKGARFARFVRFSLDILSGVPSIVYGAFGFTLLLALHVRASLLGGILTVALLIMPVMIRAMDEVFLGVPEELLEASLSLGSNRSEAAFRVILRQSIPGLVTAVLMSFGRAIGDAASVIFTAGFSDNIPKSLSDPVATLPLAIFFQMGTPFPQVRARAYSSALVLTSIILLISIVSRIVGRRLSRNIIK